MKCKKCGMELGQKNLCPVCGKDKLTDKSADPKNDHQVPSSGFSKEILAKIDEFLKAHPTDWNDEFDDFFDRQFSTANYRETVSICRHRVELFADIRATLKDARKLSADLMLRVMDEIPKKYPEIDENEARALAREFFKGRKQIRQLTLKNTLFAKLGPEELMKKIFQGEGINGIILSWKHKKNDHVHANDELCVLNSDMLMRYIQKKENMTESVNISKEECVECGACASCCPVEAITLNGDKPEVNKDLCVLCESCLGSCPVDAISINIPSKIPTVKSPWSGRIVSIRTEPVQSMDDVICEIETLD